jgi:NAD(P)-dependent dehydrogenase (short-subunit alcohol dehydrogenase family)
MPDTITAPFTKWSSTLCSTDILRGKRCVVTGATGGLGLEITRTLLKRGASVFATGRNSAALDALIRDSGTGVLGAVADLRTHEGVAGLVSAARSAYGAIDVLVNNAALFPVKALLETTPDDYEECFAINVRAPFLLVRAFAPDMISANWGRILNIGSSSAYAGFKETSLYCASKHALLGFSRAFHDELKSSGVRVICASPGSVQTPMGRDVRNQDFSTFLHPVEVARIAIDLLTLDGPMVIDEIRLNRMVVQ